ncbi:MAG: exodeoxyribonuclease V subunit gamma [Xanthomonadales bacterium]|nr:exodeoxyribonuclease V subunit gamma [Xanthomonadales bacterium]
MRDIHKKEGRPERGLAIVHSNKPENLRQLVVEHLRHYPLAPLEDEVVLTESHGIGLWLQHALATEGDSERDEGGLGISAAVKTLLPARFLWEAYRIVLGESLVPAEPDFDAARLRWLIHARLPALLESRQFDVLRRFVEVDDDPRRRFQLAQAIAELFERYQFHRADWLADWEEGHDRLRQLDGGFEDLPREQRWQPELWRNLVDSPRGLDASHRGHVHQQFLRVLGDSNAGDHPELPARITLFGVNSLPRQALEALAALANHCQVLVTVHNPCRWYWANLIEARDSYRKLGARFERKPGIDDDPVDESIFHEKANPLLAAWGRQGRDFIDLLDRMDEPGAYDDWFANPVDWFEDHADSAASTVLQGVQQGILDLQPVPEPEDRGSIDPEDRSIRFSINYSRQREVEVLYDHLLKVMLDDEDVQPRDILVMAPTIDDYAPHIHAVFGRLAAARSDGSRDSRFIPYTIGDSREGIESGYLRVFTTLLDLPASRLTSAEVVDLLHVPALRRRFGFAEGDLDLLIRWIEGSGVRWGLNAKHRERLGLGAGFSENSWHFGLRRMLLGYAVGNGDAFAEIQPYEEITGGDADLAARLSRLIECLQHWWERMSQPTDAAEWARRLARMLDDFMAPRGSEDALARHHIDQALEEFVQATSKAGLDEALPTEIVRDVLIDSLDESVRSRQFMTGSVSFSTLVPMRAIPFKVICLLGMNDGNFPRVVHGPDFDLMDGRSRPGDRARRDDDRFLFLEALLAARRHFYISWIGRDVRDSSEMPPSTVVGQLRDYIDDCFRVSGSSIESTEQCIESDRKLVESLSIVHPLQPFSRQYFSPDPEEHKRLLTYAREWRDAWPEPGLEGPERWPVLPAWTPEGAIDCRMLADFLQRPIAAYMRNRLQVWLDVNVDSVPVEEPIELDGLEKWQITSWLVEFLMAMGADEDLDARLARGVERLRREGRVPTGPPGEALLEQQGSKARNIVAHHDETAGGWHSVESPRRIRLKIETQSSDIRLEDWLDGVRSNSAGEMTRIVPSVSSIGKNTKTSIQIHHDKLLRHWPLHLAACADGLLFTTILVSDQHRVQINPVEPERAMEWLQNLVVSWLEGMTRPLPVAAKTACAFLPTHDLAAARTSFSPSTSSWEPPGEVETRPELARFHPTFDGLVSAGDKEDGFADWAEQLYGALFEHEEDGGIEPENRE